MAISSSAFPNSCFLHYITTQMGIPLVAHGRHPSRYRYSSGKLVSNTCRLVVEQSVGCEFYDGMVRVNAIPFCMKYGASISNYLKPEDWMRLCILVMREFDLVLMALRSKFQLGLVATRKLMVARHLAIDIETNCQMDRSSLQSRYLEHAHFDGLQKVRPGSLTIHRFTCTQAEDYFNAAIGSEEYYELVKAQCCTSRIAS
jgi:hypothetical protein